ncbi:MAG: hypothetical protein K5899_11715 [Bacteroidaceae bacterium]|nr:hypothetical protein [Bacteroidaceae bacterium]
MFKWFNRAGPSVLVSVGDAAVAASIRWSGAPTQLFCSALVLGYYLMGKGRIQVNKLTNPHLSQLEGRTRGDSS